MKKYLSIVLFTLVNTLFAQVQFETKVSKTSLGLNERLRVDFIMNADGDNFNPPSFEGFRVVGGPSQQISQSWVNGKSSFNKSYTYFLLPSQKGNLTIQQASIEINGQQYKTTPLKIKVTNEVETPRDPGDNSVSINDALHLVAEVSKSNPYLNEPITVVYKLYFSYNIGITNWRELTKPKYNDFWSQNIDIKQLVAVDGSYNGEKFRYIVLRKTVLYPLKSGNLEIEPLSLDIDVELPTNKRNIFGQVIITSDHKRVSAGSKIIAVKALPENGKPDNFTGAVGQFTFSAIPSKTTLKSGESLDFTVKVSGNGNLKLFTLPTPIVPSALEMYEPVAQENVTTPLSGMQGSIVNKYTIIPQFKGSFTIKALSFSYFDYKTASYKTINAAETILNVLDGPTYTGLSSTTNNVSSSKKTIAKTNQFKYIHLKTKLTPMYQEEFIGSGLFYTLFALPFIIIPIIVIAKKKKEALDGDVAGNKVRLSNKLAKKYLSEAKKHLGNKEPFYIALEKAMHNFLRAKLKIETSDMSKEKIKEILQNKKVQDNDINEFINITENCEMARYSASSNVSIQQDFDKAVAVISELEKQI